jgi:alanyl-tRNA synthetase
VHVTAGPVAPGEVDCRIDWERRFDHMQQHSGQHLLSAVLIELFAIETVGFHLGAEVSTIDVAAASLDPAQAAAAELRANQVVWENRPIAVSFEDAPADLRKPSDRPGVLRVVSIAELDRSACGGTHVRATGEIGPILIRRLDRAHGFVRVEFLCGGRAIRRARADYDALSRIARALSAAPDDAPDLVAAQVDALQAAGKARKKLAAELAAYRGREWYSASSPGPSGLRSYVYRAATGALDEEVRAAAQGFTANPKSAFVAAVEEPPALLLAASEDSGLHAGNLLKSVLADVGGRGGGNARLAQGSLPARDSLDRALDALTPRLAG